MSSVERPSAAASTPDTKARVDGLRLGKLTGLRILSVGALDDDLTAELQRRGAAEIVTEEPDATGSADRPDPIGPAEGARADTGRFDVILMLGTLRAVDAPRTLLESLRDRLTSDGMIVLEVDVVPSRAQTVLWSPADDSDGPAIDPTWRMLTERYLERFAFRTFGRAPVQPNGPVDRQVFHAFPRLPQVVLVTGPSHDGKTTLVRQLSGASSTSVHVDQILGRVLATMQQPATPLLELLDRFRAAGNRSVSQIVESAVDAGLADELAAMVCDHVPLEEPLVFVEGYGLWGPVRDAILRRLDGVAVVWVTERVAADGGPTRLGVAAPEQTVELLKAEHAQEVASLRVELDALQGRLTSAERERAESDAQLARLRDRRAVRLALRITRLVRRQR